MLLHAEFRTADGSAEPQPGVLLLHDVAGSLEQWDEVLPIFEAAGWATLAVDLRGHGKSTRREDGTSITLRSIGPLAVAAMPLDAWAGLDWLRAAPEVDNDRIAVVGAGLGANLAWVCSGTEWGVHSAVALSAGLRLSKSGEEIAGLEPKGVLLVAGAGDPGAAGAARHFAARSAGLHRVMIVRGTSGHGTDLLLGAGTGVVAPQVIDWIRKRWLDIRDGRL